MYDSNRTPRRAAGRYVLPVLVAAAVAGCLFAPEDKPPLPDPPPEYKPRTSVDNVLENFQEAHRNRHLDGYVAQLDTGYVFKASPHDTLGWQDDRLTFHEDERTMRKLFAQVQSVDMRLTWGPPQPSTFVEEYPPEEGYEEVQVTNVTLRVTTREQEGGEPVVLEADHPALMIFRRNNAVSPPTYKIIYTQDQNTGDNNRSGHPS